MHSTVNHIQNAQNRVWEERIIYYGKTEVSTHTICDGLGMTRYVPKTWVGLGQGFSSFFAKFLDYLRIFQSCASSLASSSFWQKMKKSLVQIALNIFVHGTSKTPKSRFRVPNQSL